MNLMLLIMSVMLNYGFMTIYEQHIPEASLPDVHLFLNIPLIINLTLVCVCLGQKKVNFTKRIVASESVCHNDLKDPIKWFVYFLSHVDFLLKWEF